MGGKEHLPFTGVLRHPGEIGADIDGAEPADAVQEPSLKGRSEERKLLAGERSNFRIRPPCQLPQSLEPIEEGPFGQQPRHKRVHPKRMREADPLRPDPREIPHSVAEDLKCDVRRVSGALLYEPLQRPSQGELEGLALVLTIPLD